MTSQCPQIGRLSPVAAISVKTQVRARRGRSSNASESSYAPEVFEKERIEYLTCGESKGPPSARGMLGGVQDPAPDGTQHQDKKEELIMPVFRSRHAPHDKRYRLEYSDNDQQACCISIQAFTSAFGRGNRLE